MLNFLETADIETSTADYATRFSGQSGAYFLARQTSIALSLLQDSPGAKVLDVGGGHAQLAEPLVKSGYRVTVTGSANCCRKRLDQCLRPDEFKYLTCDTLNLPIDDRDFDVVMAFRLLTHVENWQKLIAELCRVADKYVVFDYPDIRSSNAFYNQFFSMKRKLEGNTRPFTLYSRAQLATELHKHGFEQPILTPEFFLPMVIHRKLNSKVVSTFFENCFRLSGVTRLLGSPIILKSCRKNQGLVRE